MTNPRTQRSQYIFLLSLFASITCLFSFSFAQPSETGPNWVPLGPAPIVHGATLSNEATLSPPMSGRATVLAVNPKNRYNVWLGTAGGGLWVTNNENISTAPLKPDPANTNFDRNWQPVWFPMNDGFASLSIGAIILDPSGCNDKGCLVAYVGTGENSLRRDTYYGDGVYRLRFCCGEFPTWSWTRLDANKEFRFGSTAAMVLDGDDLFVALSLGVTTTAVYASVRAPEPAAGYGVHRRDNSGNWTRIFDTPSNGKEKWGDLLLPTDLIKLPSGPNSFMLGVLNDGLFRTEDRGNTWCALNPGSKLLAASQANTISTTITDCSGGTGLPAAGTFDHVELVAGPGGNLHAILGNCPSGYTDATQGATSLCIDSSSNNRSPFVFKSNGSGTSWANLGQIPLQAGVSELGHYSRYTHALFATGANELLWGGLAPLVLGTGGSTVSVLQNLRRNSLHFDIHDFAAFGGWDSGNNGVAYVATDGGFYFLPLGTNSWIAGNDSLITTEFVDIALDQEDEQDDSYPRTAAILGGLQDNSNVAFNGSPKWQLWGPVGDGGGALIQTPTITFDSIQDNSIIRRPGFGSNISATVDGLVVNQLEDVSFYVPLTQNESSKRVFVGTDVVSVRESTPAAWSGGPFPAATQISPVLGTDGHNFPAIETDRDLITALSVAPTQEWRVYVGLYSGKVWRSTTAPGVKPMPTTADWKRADGGLPSATISSIAVDPNDPAKVWVAFSDFINQTVWFSDNSGDSNWVARSNGLPAMEPVKVIKTVKDQPGTLWVGTDLGVYVTTDGGLSWQSRTANIPKVPVFDIEIDYQNNRVFAATHGRGVWMFAEGGPQLTVFEGWMEDGIWDIPIYGINFECARNGGCNCTVDIEREDGTVCASGTNDAAGQRMFIAQGDHLLRTENQGSCTRCEGLPVAFGCFNGQCVGPTPLSNCNQGGHRVSAVKVKCEDNPVPTGSVPGFCPEQSNPPSNVFEVSPPLILPGTSGGPSGGSPSPMNASLSLLLTPTILASPANGGDRALCSALLEFDPSDLAQTQLDLRDAINTSFSCQAAGVAASVVQELPLLGEDSPGVRDLQVGVSAPGLKGTQMILGVAAPPGDAVGLCFNMNRLGVYLGNQIAITQMTFPTGPSGAAGGEIIVSESSPVGTCTMRVPTSAGWNGLQIAQAVAQTFQAPGVPQPRTCPESNNPHDMTQDGASVVTILPTRVTACVYDEGVGFSFGPHGIPVGIPLPQYQYAAKIICGIQKDPEDMRLARGGYATTINIHNPGPNAVSIFKRLALSYPPKEQSPGAVMKIGADLLPPEVALKTDCNDVKRRLFPQGFPTPYIEGFVVAESSDQLDVVGVYTTAALDAKERPTQHSSIHLQQVPARRLEKPRRPPENGEEPQNALLCYDAESERPVDARIDIRTQLNFHPRTELRRLRWLCEPAFKAHEKDKLPDHPPTELPLSCYQAAGESVRGKVLLADRNGFFEGIASLGRQLIFCDPVTHKEVDGQISSNSQPFPSHFLGYEISADTIELKTVYTIDSFGTREIRFRRTHSLFEPATKNNREAPIPNESPYHCYFVEEATPVDRKVLISDQFGKPLMRVTRPTLFCDPTERNVQ